MNKIFLMCRTNVDGCSIRGHEVALSAAGWRGRRVSLGRSRRRPIRGATGIVLLISSVAALIAVGAPPAAGQEPSSGQNFRYQGPGQCSLCHSRKEEPSEFVSIAFCALDEYSVWKKDDIHSRSFELLNSDLGKRIAEGLGWKASELPDKQECISCHVGLQPEFPIDPPGRRPLVLSAGVSCESCHGPSSQWLDAHKRPDASWRMMSPSRKLEEFGFLDVRRTSSKARLCFSCHIGDPQQNRVVTHEMYAAGHPPLPGIEVMTFEDAMPSHWRSVREKPKFIGRAKFVTQNYGPDELAEDATPEALQQSEERHLRQLPRFRTVAVSGIVAYQQSLKLLADQAQRNDERSAWPELAVFDCQACHHELRSPSVRSRLGYGDRLPGRPSEFQWPQALVQLGLRQLPDADRLSNELTRQSEQLTNELNRRPFGRPDELRAAVYGTDADRVAGLIGWLDDVIGRLESEAAFDQDASDKALEFLCGLEPRDYADYHSARQIAWAVQSLMTERSIAYPELNASESLDPGSDIDAIKASEKKLNVELEKYRKLRDDRNSERRKNDTGWQQQLITALPTLRTKPGAGTELGLAESLSEDLERVSKYDPREFQLVLEAVLDELKQRQQQ